VICPGEGYHKLIHCRMRVRSAGGNPNTDKLCSLCKKAKPRTEFYRNKAQWDGYSHRCIECHQVQQRAARNSKAVSIGLV
jgi:hypothetical protein